MKNLNFKFLLLLMAVCISSVGWGQTTLLVNYNFNSGASDAAFVPALATGILSTFSSTSTFATVTGVVSGGSAFTSNPTAGAARTINPYGAGQFHIVSLGGTNLNNYINYKFYVQSQRSGTGPTTYTISYSTDGTTYTNFGTGTPGNGSWTEQLFDCSTITALNNNTRVIFKILPNGTTGTIRFDNLQIQAFNSPSGSTDPTVINPTATSITTNSALLGATVTTSSSALTSRGVVYDLTPSPTANFVSEGGTGLTSFTQTKSGLTPNTLYYFRGRATNATLTDFSPDGSFTTLSNAPSVGTGSSNSFSTLTTNWTAPTGGGSASYTYEVHVDDDIAFGSVNASVSGISSATLSNTFSSGISGGTTYYFRVRANNAGGSSAWSSVSAGIATPAPPLLYETFGTATITLPACEVSGQQNTGNLPSGWTLSTGTPGYSPCGNWGLANNAVSSAYTGASGSSNLCINNYTTTSTLAVISPSINATGATGIGIQYASRGTSTFSQTVNCYWSIDNGTTWNLIYGDNNTSGGWRLNPQFVLPAAANGASNLKFKWETAQNNTLSGNYRIDDVIVTEGNPFILPTQISITGINSLNTVINPQANYTFGVRFQLLDATGNIRAVTTSSTFVISKSGGSGSLTGTTSVVLAPGAFQGDFTSLNYSAVESGVTFTVTQTLGSPILPSANKSGISILGLTETILPQNINGINELTGYYPAYLTLSGLSPNTQYNYYFTYLNSITDVATGFPGFTGASYGGGNVIAVNPSGPTYTRLASISVASTSSASFTTNGSGGYSGWFISESGTGSTRINPGQDINFRLSLNNGPGSSNTPSNVFTTTQTVRARALASTSDASSGTFIYGNSYATAKNLVLLWDNVAGTGRPLAGTFVEDGGVANPGSFASTYATAVYQQNSAWGTIIPNNNANGVRRISQLDIATGGVIYTNTSSGTTWNGYQTANATGGSTPIILTAAIAPLSTVPSLNTYVWSGVSGAAWNVASNWTPTRTTPSASDLLSISGFNGTITAVPTQTIDKLTIENSTVTLNAGGTNTLTIGQNAGTDLIVSANSTLNLASSNVLTIALSAGNKGSIFGTVSTTGATHKIGASSSTDPITFYSGAVAGQGGGSMFNGTSSIVFNAGASFLQNAGGNPFSNATFDPSAIYSFGYSTTPSSNRVYPILTVKSGVTLGTSGPNQMGSLIVESGAIAQFNANTITITGNSTILGAVNFTGAGTLRNDGIYTTNPLVNSVHTLPNLVNNGTMNFYSNTLSVTSSLTNSGTINISNGGTLLQGSSTANSGGTYNITRSATNVNDWSFYSAPVSGATISVLSGGGPIYSFDETAASSYTLGWTGVSGTLTPGKGYITFPNNVTFSGVANNGNVSIPVTLSAGDATAVGWNLVGNPYPSSLRASTFLSGNSGVVAGGTVYLWQNNQYLPYITAGTEQIGSGQSFFVQVQAAGSVSFTNAMRGTINSTFFRTEEVSSPYVRLRLVSGSDWQDAIVGFDANATDGYDATLDGGLMNGNTNISFYSTVAGHKLTTQSFAGPLEGSKVVPLYYTSTKGGSYTINLQNYYNPDASLSIALRDNTTGMESDISSTPVTATLAKGNDVNRFDLVFRKTAVTSTNNDGASSSLSAFTTGESLYLSFTNPTSTTADVYLFNTMGQEMMKSAGISTAGTKSFLTSGLNKGVYIVKVGFANGKVENRKVVIE